MTRNYSRYMILFFIAGCVCPEEDVGFQQFTPKYVHYSEKSKELVENERIFADQLFSVSRSSLTASKFLQQLCFKTIRDACVVLNYSSDLLLYYPGKGMLLSPSIIEMSQFQSQLQSILFWEYNRRILRLPMFFKSYELNKELCIDERPDPSPENLSDLNSLTYSSNDSVNPRALPLILDSLKNRVTCKSIGFFAFQKNYYLNLLLGELRRKYANRKENITTREYTQFYEQNFKSSSKNKI